MASTLKDRLFVAVTAAVAGAIVTAAATAYFDICFRCWLGIGDQNKVIAAQQQNDRHDKAPDDAAQHNDHPSNNDLNRARLNGTWTIHDDGSYGWATHAMTIKLPVPGGYLVNASDTRWEFRND